MRDEIRLSGTQISNDIDRHPVGSFDQRKTENTPQT